MRLPLHSNRNINKFVLDEKFNENSQAQMVKDKSQILITPLLV